MWRILRPDAVGALEDPKVVSALPRYVRAAKGELLARYVVAQSVAADWDPVDRLEDLWEIHSRAVREMESLLADLDSGSMSPRDLDRPKNSLLHLKSRIAALLLESCVLCERRCRKDRARGELGFCRVGAETRIHSSFVHLGEEPEIVPSFTVCGRLCRPAELASGATSNASTARTGR